MQFGKKITVRCPGTIANLVCGFDVLGLCLQDPYDEMDITLLSEKRVVINAADGYELPTNPTMNTAGAPLLEMIQDADEDFGFELTIRKNIKPGSGVGSSAASAAGAVVGANYLLNNRCSKEDLVRYAMFGEKVACGVKHADNIAPGIYGGVTLIRSIFPLDIIAIPSPPLHVALVHPQIEVKTADARQILRKEVLLKDAIKQWGNIAGLVAGFFKNDYELISRSLEDVIVEPVRSILIPGFSDVKKKCIEAGALGGGISGSGPSIFMLCKEAETAMQVSEIMKEVYTSLGIDHHVYVTQVNGQGATIVDH